MKPSRLKWMWAKGTHPAASPAPIQTPTREARKKYPRDATTNALVYRSIVPPDRYRGHSFIFRREKRECPRPSLRKRVPVPYLLDADAGGERLPPPPPSSCPPLFPPPGEKVAYR